MSVRKLVMLTVLGAFVPVAARADEKSIREVLTGYEKALNASDADAVTKLYTADAVLMASNNKPAVGREAVAAVYGGFSRP
jgi:uncharacterized protein (TIGR02246 family)